METETEPESTDPIIEPMDETTDIVVEAPTVDELVAGYSPETVDLIDALTTEEQETCAETVYDNTSRDDKTRSKWLERHAQILKLALGDLPPPEDGAFNKARIHFGIILKACIRMQARIYDQQFPSNGEYFGVKPTDALDLARSVRVAKHLNWQLLHQVKEYVPNHDALIMQWLLYGSAFTYVYWDPIRNRPCHEVCNTEDIILPYFIRRNTVNPSLGDLPRITRVVRKYRRELEALQEVGYYKHVDELYEDEDGNELPNTEPPSSQTDTKSTPVQDAVDQDAGITKDGSQKGAPRVLWEQHTWYRFPKEAKERPVTITIDKLTKKLLCIRLRENEDPEDQARYNRDKQAAQAAYEMAKQRFEMDMAAYLAGMQQAPTMTPMPMQGTETMTAPPMPGAMTPSVPVNPMMPPPQPPPPPPEPNPPRMVPIDSFTHYVCIPNPEGIYGLGIGSLLEGPNIAADVMASQMVDAGTLHNTVSGVKSRQAKFRGGDIEIAPGVLAEVDLMPGELKDAFHFFQFEGADPTLGNFINQMKEEGDEISGAGDILSGEVGGSNETATTTQIRISQAMASISILNKRYTRARTCEGEKFARLNSVYLDDVQYFTVVDPFKLVPQSDAEVTYDEAGNPQLPGMMPQKISQMDYLQDVDITVTADPRMASQPQRVQEATQAFQMFSAIPFFAANPPFMSALAKNILVAMDRPELIRALETPLPPMMPPGMPPGGPPQPNQGPPPAKPKAPGPPQPGPTGTRVPNTANQPANGEMTT